MKNILKRSLCLLTTLMMLLPLMCAGVSAEVPTDIIIDADNLVVNDTNTRITNLPSYITFKANVGGNAADTMKPYKLSNVLGLTGESVIEFIAREQRELQPKFVMQGIEFEADSDFYLTMDFYIGDARSSDIFALNGKHLNVSSKEISSNLYLTGDGKIVCNARAYDGDRGAAYKPKNWYRFIMAATRNAEDSSKYDFNYYIDGINMNGNGVLQKSVNPDSTTKDVTISNFGISLVPKTGTTDFGGLPQWFALKDMRIVNGTYTPANSSTAVSSSEYSVAASSVALGGNAAVDAYVKGVPANTSVSTFLGNITVPTGATKKVVKIAEDNLATTVVGDGETVTSDMKLLITSVDGAMKLYDIEAEVDASMLPSVSSNADYPAYVVAENTISIPDTTVAKLKDRITLGEGTTVKVVDANGYEVADNKAVTDTMKLVATKNNYDVEYALEITKNDWLQVQTMGDTPDITENVDNANYFLYKYAWDATADKPGFFATSSSSGTVGRIKPFNSSGASTDLRLIDETGTKVEMTEKSVYALTPAKMPKSQAYAYKASSTDYAGWVSHWTTNMLQKNYDDVMDKTLDKTIMSFKLYLEEGAAANFAPYHDTCKVSDSDKSYRAEHGDALMFKGNEISLVSGALTASALPTVNTVIGTYQNNTEYDIKIVETTPDAVNGSDGVTLEAIYVNNKKIYPTGNENIVLSTAKAYGLHSFRWESHGTVYWGDIQIYMTDNYALPEAAAEEADLSISSNAVTIEGDRIYGWESIRTVADLKAKINSAATTEVEVLNLVGSAALAENVALENGMLFRVTDKNHPENTAYYVLAKTTTDSGTTVTVDGNKVTASRQVLVYTAESAPKSMAVILAVYEGDVLKTAKLDSKTIQATGDYDFSVEIEGYDPATMTVKAFAWDMGTLVPYEGITDKITQAQ